MCNLLDEARAYENGELTDEEAIRLFHTLFDEHLEWVLRGSAGRFADRLAALEPHRLVVKELRADT